MRRPRLRRKNPKEVKKLSSKQKPAKDKRFRVTLSDDQGNEVHRDVDASARIGLAAKQLVPALMEKREHGKAVPEKED